MANEVESTVSVAYDDGLSSALAEVAARVLTSTGKRWSRVVQTVGITEEALNMGDITNPGVILLRNLDPTNFVNVKVATGGAIFAKLLPDTTADGKGGFILIERMGSGALAPYVIADTAACKVDVFVVEV